MIAAVLLAVQAMSPTPVAQIAPPAPVSPLAAPPVADWPSLPIYPLSRTATIADASSYVRDEVAAGRCRIAAPVQADGTRIVAPVAILVGSGGAIRRIVPRAIGCPTVEQYTVGYLLSVTRTGGGVILPPAPGWYRSTVTYRW